MPPPALNTTGLLPLPLPAPGAANLTSVPIVPIVAVVTPPLPGASLAGASPSPSPSASPGASPSPSPAPGAAVIPPMTIPGVMTPPLPEDDIMPKPQGPIVFPSIVPPGANITALNVTALNATAVNATANATALNATAVNATADATVVVPVLGLPSIVPPMPLPDLAAVNTSGSNATALPGMPGMPTPLPGLGPLGGNASNATNEMGPKPAGSGGSSSGQQVGNLAEFEQCGGAGGNCKSQGGDTACVDAIFPGKGCSAGLECVRQNFFYRQCLKPDVIKKLGSAWILNAPAARADCPKGFVGFQQQCGGKGGACKDDPKLGGDCKDAAAPGICCETGTSCTRQNEWFWQCSGQPTNSAQTN